MKLFYRALLTQGKSIPWLAKKLGISHQTVYQWRFGRTKPRPKHLKEIARILNVPVEKLINDHY